MANQVGTNPTRYSRNSRKNQKQSLEELLADKHMDVKLKRWGKWRRTDTYKLGVPGRNILDKVMKREIFGNGLTNAGYDPTKVNQITIIEDHQSESIDNIFRALLPHHEKEMQCVFLRYVLDLNDRQIAHRLNLTRYFAQQKLITGRQLMRFNLPACRP